MNISLKSFYLTRGLFKQSSLFSLSQKSFGKLVGSTSFDGKTELTKCKDINSQIKAPPDALIGVLSACELHSIMHHVKANAVKVEKIEVNVDAEYDSNRYLEKAPGPNTYSYINIEANIYSSEKDKAKLEKAVAKGIERCPILNTLKLAGVPIKEKVNYL